MQIEKNSNERKVDYCFNVDRCLRFNRRLRLLMKQNTHIMILRNNYYCTHCRNCEFLVGAVPVLQRIRKDKNLLSIVMCLSFVLSSFCTLSLCHVYGQKVLMLRYDMYRYLFCVQEPADQRAFKLLPYGLVCTILRNRIFIHFIFFVVFFRPCVSVRRSIHHSL